MNKNRWYFMSAAFIICVLLNLGCPPNNPDGDITPPELIEVKVQLESPTPPNPRGEFDITSQDI